jgi:CubicO group peptidase (beta-lactamase class C family)
MSSPVSGTCDPAFAGVREVFAASLADGSDLGASACVFVDGRPVVDLWGGVADRKSGRPWTRDTACVTFSATKAVTATAALLLAERGAVSLDAPVAEWWPQFGAHGKDSITPTMLLTHTAGLPAFDRPISAQEAADFDAMTAQLAGQSPEWEPGTQHGYHALTFGWLVGELVRRHGRMGVGEFVRREIGPDLWVGVPESMLDGLAHIAAASTSPAEPVVPRAADEATVAAVLAAQRDPDSPMLRSTANPSASFNKPVLLTAGWPAAGLVCTARALAEFYARLADGAILSRGTVRDAVRERVRGPDRTLVFESAFGLGYMRPCQNMFVPPSAHTAFGHPGASGALGLGDPEARVAIGYIPNLSRPGAVDRRAYRLVDEVYRAL